VSAEPDPAECRRRLEQEGIQFHPIKGTASREQYVSWDVLMERNGQH
jgi:hypothetical protein